jgi:hypothetical protein
MAIIQWLQHHSVIMMGVVFIMILVTTHIPLDDDR